MTVLYKLPPRFPRYFTSFFSAILLFLPTQTLAEPEHRDVPMLVAPAPEAPVPAITNPAATAKSEKSSVSGEYLSSYVAHNTGDVTSAIRYLEKVLEKEPDNMQIAGQLLVMKLMHGDVEEAIALSKTMQSQKDHELIVDLLVSIDHVKRGELQEADDALTNVNSESFDHIWMPLLNAWLEPDVEARKKPVRVQDLLGEDITDVPSFLHYHLALINDYRGLTAEAEKQYEQAVADKQRAPFRALLAYINLRARMNDRETIQQLMLDLKESRPEMVELLEQELPYLTTLGTMDTLPQTKLIATPADGVSEVLLTMASMLYMLNAGQDIALYLQLALYLKPDFPTAQLMLANVFENFEHWDDALAVYMRVKPSSPLYLKAGIRRAFIMEEQDKPMQAMQIIDRLIANYPNMLEPLIAKGDIYRSREDFAQAADTYSLAIAKQDEPRPEHWNIYFARGACYEQLGDITRAESDLQYSLRLNSEQPEVLNYLGYMWLTEDRNIERAVEMIQQAYKLSPSSPHIIDSMGWAFLKIGKLEEAAAMLEKAAEMVPNDPIINEHLGDVYWHAGRKIEARFQWRRAIDFTDNKSKIGVLEKKIEEGLSIYSVYTMPEAKLSLGQ